MAAAKRVVLFGIDGAGTFFEQASTPHMDRIFRDGALCPRVLTEVPSISAQCWGSMLHGVACGWHGLTNSLVDETPYPQDSPWPSVFRVLREALPGAELACFSDWASINVGIVEEGLGVLKHNAPDRELIEPAVRYIGERDFTFLFFQFDSVDGAGHRYGYGTPEHLQAITRCDGYIGRVVRALEDRGWLEETLLLVEADHGGTPNFGFGGQHGGATDEERFVSFFAAGPGILSGTFEGMLVRDTPAVILRALGIPQPRSWTARVPAGLFRALPEGTERPQGQPPARALPEPAPGPADRDFPEAAACLEPLLYLPFESDGQLPPQTRAFGKIYRVPGLRGCALDLRDGGLALPLPALGESWSLGLWVKPELPGDGDLQTLLTLTGSGQKLRLELGGGYVRLLCLGLRETADLTLPADTRGSWRFLAVIRHRDRFGLSAGFGPITWWDAPGRLFAGPGSLLLGNCPREPGNRLASPLDELCIYGKGLDTMELESLGRHYGLR